MARRKRPDGGPEKGSDRGPDGGTNGRSKKKKRVTPGPAAPADTALPPAADSLFETEHLLERSRTNWQYGAWEALEALDPEELARDSDRAKLMLLVAAAQGHRGASEAARASVRQAIAWGCDRRLAARVLISAVHNSLGRAAAVLEDGSADGHFRDAIALVEPRADVDAIARARQIREMARLGLGVQAARLVDDDLRDFVRAPAASGARIEALASQAEALRALLAGVGPVAVSAAPDPVAPDPAAPVAGAPDPAAPTAPPQPRAASSRFDATALARYTETGPDLAGRYLYLDSKSLPRSGLHFLRNRLARVLGPAFSFCERYQEPGCCGTLPCRLPMFPRGDGFALRLIKSHDFDLADPVFAPAPAMKRVVMIRDPLFVLTSWWSLNLLHLNQDVLRANGIAPEKLFYMHERPLLAEAYDIVARAGTLEQGARFERFLENAVTYVSGFMAKWADPAHLEMPGVELVGYEETLSALLAWLEPVRARLSDEARDHLDRIATETGGFAPRSDPFAGPTAVFSEHLAGQEAAFRACAAQIIEADPTGHLARLSAAAA